MYLLVRVLVALGVCVAMGLGPSYASDMPAGGETAHGLSHADGTSTGAGSPAASTGQAQVYHSITFKQIEAIARKYGVPYKIEKMSDGSPVLVMVSDPDTELGAIIPIGCRNGSCQAFIIGNTLNSETITQTAIRTFESRPRFANILSSNDIVRIEMEDLVSGGVTDRQIANCIVVYLADLKDYLDIASGAAGSASAGAGVSLGMAETGKGASLKLPAWLKSRRSVLGMKPGSAVKWANYIMAHNG